MDESKIRKIIKEMVGGRRELGSNVSQKRYTPPENINPKEFDWASFFKKIEDQLKVVNDKYVLLTIDELKNDDKINEILNEFVWLRDYFQTYSNAFFDFYKSLDQPNKEKIEEIKNYINQIATNKTRLEQVLFKMYDLLEEMGDIDQKKIF